jgi:ADP-heptose:LPS heptosyltransferase
LAAAAPLLVMRLSALGDVAMTVPVLRALLAQHPDCRVCMVSDRAYAPLFEGINRLTFVGADLKGEHRGLWGLWRLFLMLRKAGPYGAVADLHAVLRTFLLGFFFIACGVPVHRLNKGRKQKRELTRRQNKVRGALPTGFERMVLVLQRVGFTVALPDVRVKHDGTQKKLAGQPCRVGIAPFARHPEKTYPLQLMKAVVASLHKHPWLTIYLLGGAGAEAETLAAWEKEFTGVRSLAGRSTLREELKQIQQLDAMISMDSANMHLASLYQVPVVSIWGATHPDAGFMGWGQSEDLAVQVSLSCRPCSVFGNVPCFRGDHACMQQITVSSVVERLYGVLGYA